MHSSYLMLLFFTHRKVIHKKERNKKIKKELSYEDILYTRSSTPESEKTIINHYMHPSVKIMNI